jgi:uncharacterized membrane protein YeaQ/YmgE (transglycosylase-associated protein family)
MNWIIAVVMSLVVGFIMTDKSADSVIVVGATVGGAIVPFVLGVMGALVVKWSYRLFRRPFSRAQFFSVYWTTWVLAVLALLVGWRSIPGLATVSSPPLMESESPVTAAPNDLFSEDTLAARIERAEQGDVNTAYH